MSKEKFIVEFTKEEVVTLCSILDEYHAIFEGVWSEEDNDAASQQLKIVDKALYRNGLKRLGYDNKRKIKTKIR